MFYIIYEQTRCPPDLGGLGDLQKGAFNIEKSVMEIQPIKFAEIEKAYETWCKSHRSVITLRPPRISIADWIFSATISQDEKCDKEFSLKEIINKRGAKKVKRTSENSYHTFPNVECTIYMDMETGCI